MAVNCLSTTRGYQRLRCQRTLNIGWLLLANFPTSHNFKKKRLGKKHIHSCMALVVAGGAYSQVSLWVFSFELTFLSFLTQVDGWSGTKKALAFSLQKKMTQTNMAKKNASLHLRWQGNSLWDEMTYDLLLKPIFWGEMIHLVVGMPAMVKTSRAGVNWWQNGWQRARSRKVWEKIDNALTYPLANSQDNGQSHLSNETSSSYGGFKLVSHLHILLWPNDHKNWHHSFRPPKIIQNPSRGAECWKTPRKAPLRYWWWRKLHDVVPGEPFGLRPPHRHSVQPTNPR